MSSSSLLLVLPGVHSLLSPPFFIFPFPLCFFHLLLSPPTHLYCNFVSFYCFTSSCPFTSSFCAIVYFLSSVFHPLPPLVFSSHLMQPYSYFNLFHVLAPSRLWPLPSNLILSLCPVLLYVVSSFLLLFPFLILSLLFLLSLLSS